MLDLFPGSGKPSILDVIDLVDAVTSDPEPAGKKDGYGHAASQYEPIYQELKNNPLLPEVCTRRKMAVNINF